jgi:hypothetical protein
MWLLADKHNLLNDYVSVTNTDALNAWRGFIEPSMKVHSVQKQGF